LILPSTKSGHLQIFDLQGRCIVNQSVSSVDAIQLAIPDQKKGMFLIRFQTADQRIYQEKVVVE
jgi:hypothetical protein